MRVTISSQRSGEFTLSDGTRLNRWSVPGTVLGLQPDGLEGWYEPADLRVEDQPDILGVDGSYWPEEVLLTSRILTIRGFMHAIDGRASSVTVALARDRLASLVRQRLRITVEDASGAREVEGYLSSSPIIQQRTERGIAFSLIVTCPDPLKYGAEVTASATGTTAYYNTGNAPVAPRLEVAGLVRRVTVTQSLPDENGRYVQRRFEWQGNTRGLTIDLADGTPLDSDGYETGQLVWADVVRLQPGSGVVNISREPNSAVVTMAYRHGWY